MHRACAAPAAIFHHPHTRGKFPGVIHSLRTQTASKAPKTRRKPPAAASCVKMRELKRERESEQTQVRTHKLDRPAAAFRHPTDGKL